MNEEPKKNGGIKLDWPTVVLIIATGGANLIGTHQGTVSLSSEQQEALRKIREIHDNMDQFENGMKASLNNQSQILNNQSLMLRDQRELLEEIHKVTKGPQ